MSAQFARSFALAALLFLAAPLAAAVESVTATYDGAQFGEVTVTLFKTPCDNKAVLKQIPETLHGVFFNATASHTKPTPVTASACWSLEFSAFGNPVAPGRLFIIDETGEFGWLGADAFGPSETKRHKPNSF